MKESRLREIIKEEIKSLNESKGEFKQIENYILQLTKKYKYDPFIYAEYRHDGKIWVYAETYISEEGHTQKIRDDIKKFVKSKFGTKFGETGHYTGEPGAYAVGFNFERSYTKFKDFKRDIDGYLKIYKKVQKEVDLFLNKYFKNHPDKTMRR